MTETSLIILDQMVDRITGWTTGMPVRLMEQILPHGETAVPVLSEAITRWREDEAREILWPIVLLGEMRHPAAIPSLIALLHPPQQESYALAAAEGLAKAGLPAVPHLIDAAMADDFRQRLYAYAALGRIVDDRAYAFLLEALARDADLGEVLAGALSDQGRPEAVPHLYKAYLPCPSWQRIEFEEAIRNLHRRRLPEIRWNRDWRVRYRIRAAFGSFAPDWVGITAIVHEEREQVTQRATHPLRSLEEIFSEPPEFNRPEEVCENCGEPNEYPTGLPVCPETAVNATIQQGAMVEAYHRQGITDLFELLDVIEEEEWDHEERRKTVKKKHRQHWQERKEELAIHHRTCEWLIEQGIEETGPVKEFLLEKAAELTERFGLPEKYLPSPASDRPASSGPKIGRNDPCPCGSGKKYKKCCLGKGRTL